MSDALQEDDTEEKKPKGSKLPILIGLLLALAGGGGGFYAAWSGMILGGAETHEAHDKGQDSDISALSDVAFVEIDPITISMRSKGAPKHLRFRAQLEVSSGTVADVEKLLPRVVDILNGYLRALEPADIEDVSALTRLRAQMLRRIQIVTGEGRVNDLLIMEFVIT